MLAAVVWNFGENAPEAQITIETGFLLQGDTEAERVADTGPSWKCARNDAYAPVVITSGAVRGYWAAGPGDRVNAAANPWGWETPAFDDSALGACRGGRAGGRSRGPRRTFPLDAGAAHHPHDGRARWRRPLTLRKGNLAPAANAKITALFDQGYLTTAYPTVTVTGGKGATVRLRYAESLFQTNPRGKGNRNEIEGKEFIGNYDEFVLDGGAHRVFRPLWWRTYRYLQLEIENPRRTGHGGRHHRHRYGLPLRAQGEVRRRRAGAESDSGRGLAHRATVRPRDLHGLPLLRAVAVRRRYARAVPGLAVPDGRRAPDAQRHRPAQRLAAERRLHHEPLPDAPGAVHSGLRALVGRHGARLPLVRGRRRLRAPHAARRAQRARASSRAIRRRTDRSLPCPGGATSTGSRSGPTATRRRTPMAARRSSICNC